MLSRNLLNLLRQYWKLQRPTAYLFPGSQAGTHVQPGTMQEICRDACRMPESAGITTEIPDGRRPDERMLRLEEVFHPA